ncbi:hypothetical protein FRC06_005907 [Ceratobasidium sp. 370]|nr:hypothetical protein FRC06_005907 [Ceratobasidium sp. 370]
MNSTLVIRSQASTNYNNLYAPYNPESSHLSSSVAEARLHRPITQNGYWQTQPAGTYAGTNVYDPYVIQDEIVSSADAATQYDSPPPVNSQLMPSPPQEASRPKTFDYAFSLSPTAGQAETNQIQHLSSAPCAPYCQAERNPTFSLPSQPHAPESSLDLPFTGTFFSTSTAAYAYIEPAQPSPSPETHPTLPNLLVEEPTDVFQHSCSYQPGHTPTHSRPVSEGLVHSTPTTTSRPHSSYHSESYAFPPHMPHSEHRDSPVSPDDTFTYQVRDGQYGEHVRPTGYSRAQGTTCSPAVPAATAASPSGHPAQPQCLSPPPHTSVGSPPWGLSVPAERERSSSTVSSVPDIGPQNSVQRRLGILMDAQRQHSEQDDRDNQPPKQTPRKSDSVSSRRRKPSQSDESDYDSKSTFSSKPKHKESASRYKAAYERIRLQRNFLEGATASLLHQVRMLGGDPMQASDRASKGEDLDPKKARLLIASLQQDLETSRDKVIEIQTELHRLRRIIEDNPRAYNPAEVEDRIPLSAAPTTVLGHLKK